MSTAPAANAVRAPVAFYGVADPRNAEIGARLRACREAAGLTQQQLADAIGVTFQQLQKYERGDNRISAPRLLDLCHALSVDPHVLLGWNDQAETAEILSACGQRGMPVLVKLAARLSVGARAAVTNLLMTMGPDPASAYRPEQVEARHG